MSEAAHIGLDNPAFSGRLGRGRFADAVPEKTKWRQPSETPVGQPVVVPRMSVARLTTTRQPAKISYRQMAEPEPVAFEPAVQEVVIEQPVIVPVVVSQPVPEPTLTPSVEPVYYAEPQQQLEPQTPKSTVQDQVKELSVLIKQSLRHVKLPKTLSQSELMQKLRQVPGELHQLSGLQVIFVAMAGFILAIGLTVSFQAWQTNHSASAKVEALAAQAQSTSNDQPGTQKEGTPPSTKKPSSSAINSYQVPSSHPRYIDIPKLDVHARVLSLGLTKSGALATPNNVFDTGWYNSSSLPGQAGAMLIDGHVSSWTTNGVFYGIKTLKPGDAIQVSNGQGTVYNYQVVKTQVFDHDQVDMQSAVQPIDPGKPGLNLITCTGDVIKGTNEFNERVIVYAEQV